MINPKLHTNRNLWAEEPHHRPTMEEVLRDVKANVAKKNLAQTQAEKDWDLKE